MKKDGFMEIKYLRMPEVAEYTRLSIHTIKSYVLNKRIPYIKANGSVLFNINDIDSWLDRNRVTPLREPNMKKG